MVDKKNPSKGNKADSVDKKPVHKTSSFKTSGDMLRKAREDKGFTLEEVSAAINIRTSQLDALEYGRLDDLPGLVYAQGFLKTYAKYLGANTNVILQKFKQEHMNEDVKPDLHFPEPLPDGSLPTPLIAGLGALATVILIMIWAIFSSNGDTDMAQNVIEAPALVARPGSAEFVGPIDVTDEVMANVGTGQILTASAPDDSSAEVLTAQPTDKVSAVENTNVENTQEVDDPTSYTPTPDTKPTERDPIANYVSQAHQGADQKQPEAINIKPPKGRIVLEAIATSWVHVVDEKEKTIFRKVLKKGEKYVVPDQKGLLLTTSNAGGLAVHVDGARVQSLGKTGDIIRGIELNPNELKKVKIRNRTR